MLKKTVFPIILSLALSFFLIEISCYFVFSKFKDRFTFYNVEDYLMKESILPKAKKAYHKDYGWMKYYNTPYGERPRHKEFNKPLISFFGDSYTHCDQVGDNETFQYFLSRKFKADIYNFGVGGFGTDQAYLRFKYDFPKIQTPIVGLGLISENINRIVNVYRKFYFQKSELSLPKPRFKLVNNQLELIPNPLTSESNISLLQDIKFIDSFGINDYWYNRDNYPKFSFPYSNIILKKRMWLEALANYKKNEVDDTDPRPWETLWQNDEARDLMFKIFDSFVLESRDFNSTPVIFLLPQKNEIYGYYQTGKTIGRDAIMQYCLEKKYYCFDGVQVILENTNSLEEAKKLYNGHLTKVGNKLIADGIYKFINDNKLLR